MKKLLSLALAFVMVFSLTVPSAWAADSGDESPVVDGAYQDGTWAQGGYGYTHYENNEGLDLDLSKTAKPVEGSDTEFDVTLEITTRQTKTVTPPGSAATVLVMDVSDSMKDRTDGVARLQSAKKAAMNFIDGTKDQPGYRGEQSGTGRYLAIVKYCGKVTDVLGWVDVSTDAGYKAAVKAIDGLSASAGTNLDVALKHAKTFMEKDAVASIDKDQKNIIVLTDGKPTRSEHFGSNSSGNRELPKVIDETTKTAAAVQKAAQVYTVCFAAKNETCYPNGPKVGPFLKNKVATPASGDQIYAYNADNVAELNEAFAAITESVVSGLTGTGWVVTDPMGTYVTLQKVSQCTGSTATVGNTLRWTIGQPEELVDGDMTIFVYTLTYRVTVNSTGKDYDDEVYHPLNKETYVTIADQKYAFPVPGVKVPAPRFTVTYQAAEGGSLQDAGSDGKIIHTDVKKWSQTPAAPEVVSDEDHYFTGWTPEIQDTVTEDATYTAQFAEKQTLTVKAEDHALTYDGKEHTVEGLEQTSFVIDGKTYQVEGLSASQTGRDAGTSQIDVTGTARVMCEGQDVTERFTVNTESGTLTINPRPVTLTSQDAAKAYDGTPLENHEIVVTGMGLADGDSFVYSDFAALTDVGNAKNTFSYDAAAGTLLANYEVTQETGTLSVTRNTNTIIIKAASAERIYNGEPLTDSGYTFTQDVLADGDVLTATVEGTITDAGTAENVVTGWKVMRGTKDVTDFYTFGDSINGILTVKPREVVLTSGTSEKVYDGEALMNKEIAIQGDGFAEGEYFTAVNFASITDVGSVENTFSYKLDENTKAENYNISIEKGTLTVTPVTKDLVITADDNEKMYDGTPLTDSGYTFTQDVLVEGDELTAVVEGTITDAGTADNVVTGWKVMRGEKDITDNYAGISAEAGTLQVTAREVVLASGSAEKVYNGEALMNKEITVKGDGFVEGEGFIASDFASITDVGTVDNTFVYALDSSTKLQNYSVSVETGTLTITPVTADLVITADSNEKMYDGTPLTDSGFTVTDGVLAQGDRVVAEVEGTITNAGTAENVVTGWKVMRGDVDATKNYTGIKTEKGTLTVTVRDVTLTSDSASKKYDGTPLMAENVAVSGSGFADGEGAAYSEFAALNHAGEMENSFVYSLNENTLAENYDITVVNGVLHMNKHTDAALQAEGYTGVYDGEAHEGVTDTAIIGGVEGDEWTYTYSIDGETYTDEMPLFQNVGTYTVWVTAANDNYEGDALTTTVTVQISPADVIVTADSHTIATGDADPELTYSVETSVASETPAFTGSLTREGSSARGVYAIGQGTLALCDGEDFLAANYNLKFVPGELTILQRAMNVVKTADKSEIKAGEKVTYTITVTNTGEVELTNVVVKDDMMGTEETIAKLAVGESKTFEYVYTATKADEGKTLVNYVTVTADGGENEETESDETRVIPVAPETGDQSHLVAWVVSLVVAAAAVTVLVVLRRKQHRS